MPLLKVGLTLLQGLSPARIITQLRPSSSKGSKIFLKSFLLLILSAVIGALLSPHFVMPTMDYQEGDIILENVVIPEDMLLKDTVSTRLKGNSLIKELGMVFDYDPKLFATQVGYIQSSFKTAQMSQEAVQQKLSELSNQRHLVGLAFFQLNQEYLETAQKIKGYQQYKHFLTQELSALPTPLRGADVAQKFKLDADLQISNRLINDLSSKLRRDRGLLKKSPKTFTAKKKAWLEESNQVKKQEASITTSFLDSLGVELPESERSLLDFDFTNPQVEREWVELFTLAQNKQIITRLKDLSGGSGTPMIRNLSTGNDEPYTGPEQFTSLETAKTQVTQLTEGRFLEDKTGNQRSLAILLTQQLLRPTVTLNKKEFESRKQTLITQMSPAYFSLKKGEVIARAGDRATHHQVEVLQSYFKHSEQSVQFPKMLGTLLIVLFSLLLVYYVLQYKGKQRIPFKVLLLMGSSLVITLALVKVYSVVGEAISMRYPNVDSDFYRFLFPVSLAAMLVGILVNFETALLAGLLTSLFATVMLHGDLYFFFFAMTGSMVAAMPITKFDSRHSLLIQGLKVALSSFPAILVILLIQQNQLGAQSLSFFITGAFSGISAAVIVSVVLPLFEALFDITTNLRLLELSNMNHPALKNLIFSAPGTYQHSILVGNLSESAAQVIGANPLLSRVGAYYHDLGKGVDSHYFIENQPQNSTNIHDTLNDPYTSARKIISHLKEGEAIADKHRLGSLIKEMITQHHGTSVVKYFYEQALTAAKAAGTEDKVAESEFRYPGPKPQSLEAGLIMLADAAEASTRSLTHPTEGRVGERVQQVGWAILKDGQLDESGMNLAQFRDTLACFTKVLLSIHHHRIQYPEEVELVSSTHEALV